MKSGILTLFWLFAFAALVSAISSNEAENFVVEENTLLLEGEDFQTPVTTIKGSKESFWLFPVLSGDDIVTYLPVKERAKEISTSRAVNRDLFKTADILRELALEKERVSGNPSVDWLFTSTYNLLFNNLSLSLNNEIFQLNTIASTLNDQTVNSKVELLNRSLASMSERSSEISSLINGAISAENSFNSAPSVVKVNDLKEKFQVVIVELGKLNDEALNYRTEINKLKDLISKSEQEAATKTHLIALADPPPEFNSIGNYVLDASEISAGIDSVYSRVNSRMDALLDEFDLRLKRNQTFKLLYEHNESVSKQTDRKFSSIKEVVDFVLAEQNRPYWRAQSFIHAVESNWNQAQKAFNERNYEAAEFASKKALSEALKVYRQGFIDVPPVTPLFSEETIFQIITALVVLLVVVFAYNNRKKILDFVKQDEEEKEVDLRGL